MSDPILPDPSLESLGSRPPSRQENLAVTIGVNLVLQAVGIATGAMVSRLLGVNDRGVLALAFSWAAAITYVGDLGAPVAFSFLAATKRYSIEQLEANSYWLSLIQTAALAIVGIPLIAVILRNQFQAVAITQLFLLAYLPTNLVQRYLLSLLQGTNRFRAYGFAIVSVQLTYGMVVLILLLVHLRSTPLVLTSMIAGNIVAIGIAFRGLGRPPRPSWPDVGLMGATFNYGVRAHVGTLAPIERLQADLLVVSAVLGPYSAGLYVVASSAASLPKVLGFAMGMVALPHVAMGETEGARLQAVGSMFRLGLLLILGVTIPLELAIGFLLPLVYGAEFAGAVPLAQILIIGTMAASLRRTLGDCLRGLGHPMRATIPEAVGWLIAGAGMLFLVPTMSAMGAAIAVVLSFLTALGLSFAFAAASGVPLGELLLPRAEDLSAARSLGRELVQLLNLRGRRPTD
jgi:O-antigen/teichoic acid export membrane protein